MPYINARHLQDRFQLPPALARDIAGERTRQALLRRWQPWAWLAGWTILLAATIAVGWLPPLHELWHRQPFALLSMIFVLYGWVGLGRWLAGPAMLSEAAAKARRLGLRG